MPNPLDELNEALSNLEWYVANGLPFGGSDNLKRVLWSVRHIDDLLLTAKFAIDAAMSDEKRKNMYFGGKAATSVAPATPNRPTIDDLTV